MPQNRSPQSLLSSPPMSQVNWICFGKGANACWWQSSLLVRQRETHLIWRLKPRQSPHLQTKHPEQSLPQASQLVRGASELDVLRIIR
ncbi:hypothetical protein CJ030_MR2G024909 [Morella rubra]|uniref:Uncharacterized protein n=1 Tax=Morella rubra TaxID=262757 RepID=A0A6A1W7Y0_9ROSI|nr:hypothetical protein CJ030_MR2G024909 [Morella rubra]